MSAHFTKHLHSCYFSRTTLLGRNYYCYFTNEAIESRKQLGISWAKRTRSETSACNSVSPWHQQPKAPNGARPPCYSSNHGWRPQTKPTGKRHVLKERETIKCTLARTQEFFWVFITVPSTTLFLEVSTHPFGWLYFYKRKLGQAPRLPRWR